MTQRFKRRCFVRENEKLASRMEWKSWVHFFWIIPTSAKSAEFMKAWNEKMKVLIENAG